MSLVIQPSVNYHGNTRKHEELHPKSVPMVGNIKSSLIRKMSWVPQYKLGIWDQITRKEVSNLRPVNQIQACFWANLNSQLILKANMVSNDLHGWEITQTGSRCTKSLQTEMACWPTTTHTHVTKLKKAVMGPSRGITGMELPFPSLYAPCYLLPRFKKPKQCAWGIMKPDHQHTLERAAAWPQGTIY